MKTSWLAATLLVLFPCCASYSSRTSARTVAHGKTEMVTAIDGVLVKRGREYTVLPAPEFTIRRGMGAAWDVGAVVHLLGVRAGVRRNLRSSRSFALAIAPELGVSFALATNDSTDLLRSTLTVPLVAELDVSRSVSAVIALKPSATLAAPPAITGGSTDAARVLLEPGLGVGLRIRISKRLTLWPEINAHIPYAIGEGAEPVVAQGGVALMF